MSIPIPPGTEIFGVVYSDATTGGWHRNHAVVHRQIIDLRVCGLQPIGILRLRMRSETLEASE